MTTKLVCFDLDGTLTTTKSTFHFVAERLGFIDELARYNSQTSLVNNTQISDGTAPCFKGVSLPKVREMLFDVPTIANIRPTISALKRRGIIIILASITWDFLVEFFANEYAFDYYCGTQMKVRNNILTGEIGSYCTSQDKMRFFLNTCTRKNIALRKTIAVGDSKSDHPVFHKAGKSIALNADADTKNVATYYLDTGDLLDIIPFIE